MPKNSKTQKSNTQLFDEAVKAQGAANVAQNNAAVETQNGAEESKRRGRKPSTNVTLASFTAHVKAGLTELPGKIEFSAGGVEVKNGVPMINPMRHISAPVLSLDEGGNLTISRYTAINQGHITAEILAGPVPADKVLEFVKNFKPATN